MKHFSLAENIISRMKEVEQELGVQHDVMSLDCHTIDVWEYINTKYIEYPDFNKLSESMHTTGQLQPIIVVKASADFKSNHNKNAEFIILDGQHRWQVCKQFNIPINAVVKHLSFDQALDYVLLESKTRKQSDYAIAMLCHHLLQEKKYTPHELHKKLNITLQRINALLNFSLVPEVIWDAVNNLSQVSAASAKTIKELAEKGPDHVAALIAIAPQIRKGFGAKRICHLVYQLCGDKEANDVYQTLYYFEHDGKRLMSLKKNILTLNKEMVENKNFDNLVNRFEHAIKDWQSEHIKKK